MVCAAQGIPFTMNKSVDDFDAAFAKTGAVKGAENVKVDLNAEEEDIENLEAFAKALAAKI